MTIKFTQDHEYIRIEGQTGIVGITAYAQEQLGDIVFVELPPIGKTVKKGDETAVVESVKAASEIYAPVGGTIEATNEALGAEPAMVNQDPLGTGWMYQIHIEDPSELDGLMDEAAYADFIK